MYWYASGLDAIAESDLAGNLTAEYIFVNGKRAARLDMPAGTVNYYFSNHLGSANVVTSATGVVEDESDFYPFGGERVVANGDPNAYKFTGKERDTESNLDFFIARYYASNYGRFLSPDEFTGGPVDAFSAGDPLPPGVLPYADASNPQSLNKYAYTYNNPIAYLDPNGHSVLDFMMGVGNAVASNFVGGAGRQEANTRDFANGQAVGDALSVLGGTIEVLAGASAGISGAAACTTVAGCLVGAPAATAGVAVSLHGVATGTSGIVHLAEGIPNPFGSTGAPDHQDKVVDLQGKAAGEAKAGETLETNRKIKGHDSNRRPDVQILNKKGKTRKVFEAERNPQSKRNKKREAEYRRLGIQQETHPLEKKKKKKD